RVHIPTGPAPWGDRACGWWKDQAAGCSPDSAGVSTSAGSAGGGSGAPGGLGRRGLGRPGRHGDPPTGDTGVRAGNADRQNSRVVRRGDVVTGDLGRQRKGAPERSVPHLTHRAAVLGRRTLVAPLAPNDQLAIHDLDDDVLRYVDARQLE